MNSISSELEKPSLKNTIPRNAPNNVDDMTVQEEREYHRRIREDEYIKSLDDQIDDLLIELKKAQNELNAEVERINLWRKVYDGKTKVKEARRSAGSVKSPGGNEKKPLRRRNKKQD